MSKPYSVREQFLSYEDRRRMEDVSLLYSACGIATRPADYAQRMMVAKVEKANIVLEKRDAEGRGHRTYRRIITVYPQTDKWFAGRPFVLKDEERSFDKGNRDVQLGIFEAECYFIGIGFAEKLSECGVQATVFGESVNDAKESMVGILASTSEALRSTSSPSP
jgi:hypothetical protein